MDAAMTSSSSSATAAQPWTSLVGCDGPAELGDR
jgi:hypothetical protein